MLTKKNSLSTPLKAAPLKAGMNLLMCAMLMAPLGVVGGVATTIATATTAHALSVNGQTISSKDVKQRAALMRLRRIKGAGTSKARRELIDEAIKLQEAKRLGVMPSESEINQAYAKFAKGNRLTTSKLNTALNQAGVTSRGFKAYIRAQMAWPRVVAAKARKERSKISQDKILRDLRASGAPKPTSREFFLQQVIFVVPAKKRSRLGKRKAEARAFRKKFQSCDNTKQLAVGTLDVSVRSLGRMITQEIPALWRKDLENLSQGGTTPVKTTDKGAEFIAVCSVKEVSDDKVAVLSFMEEQRNNSSASKLSKKYFAELKSAAKIN